jgi:hypothetical protein
MPAERSAAERVTTSNQIGGETDFDRDEALTVSASSGWTKGHLKNRLKILAANNSDYTLNSAAIAA